MRLCVMPSDWDGSGHYRCLFPARELQGRGHDVVVAPHRKVFEPRSRRMTPVYGAFTSDNRLVTVDEAIKRLEFDLLVMQQRREPGIGEWLGRAGFPTVIDSDDAWFDMPAYNPGGLKPQVERGNMVRQLRAAAAMTVSTPELAEMYAPFCDDITVIRNSLDWSMWDEAPDQSVVERRRIRIGYMGHADWHRGDLRVLAGVLSPWLARNPGVEFAACGDPLIHELLDIPKDQRVSVAGTEFWHGDLADITACFDIGLVPLDRNRMNECKSHLKGLEYAACGIPCIATPTESYRYWVEPGVNGFLADKPSQWLRHLDTLVNDDGLRREMGSYARAKARKHSIEHRVGEWEAVYDRVCGSHTHPARAELAA